jgi:PPOX class probable F420-dependent enzyme
VIEEEVRHAAGEDDHLDVGIVVEVADNLVEARDGLGDDQVDGRIREDDPGDPPGRTLEGDGALLGHGWLRPTGFVSQCSSLWDDRYDAFRDRNDDAMSDVTRELRDLIAEGPMAHLSTINADGSPQVTVIWIGLDGEDLVSGHMSRRLKLRNIERDPRVVLSLDAPRVSGVFLNEYAVIRARASVQPSEEAWDLLNSLAKVYVSPTTEFPSPRGPGYVVRYKVERIGGVGPWTSIPH